MELNIDKIEKRISSHVPQRISDKAAPARAGVSLIIRAVSAMDILFIKRAKAPCDHWSGHMAFPGGRQEPDDSGVLECAVRETWEETGLDLNAQARELGALDDIRAVAAGRKLPMAITPFVFLMKKAVEVTVNYEVERYFWIPVKHFFDKNNHTVRPYKYEGRTFQLPAYVYQEHIIWGLTFRIFLNFLDIAGLTQAIPDHEYEKLSRWFKK